MEAPRVSASDSLDAILADNPQLESAIEERAKKRADEILKERGVSRGMPGGGDERFIPQPPGGDARGLLQKALEDSAGGDKGPVDVRDLVQAGVVEGAKELIESGKV